MNSVPGVAIRSVELDFLRGVAILLVMGVHFTFPTTGLPPLDWLSHLLKTVGGVGVNLFFALSGFLVGGLLLKEYKKTNTIRPWRFLARRAFKIWPPFYVLILFHLVVGHHERSTFFWQNFFQVQNYFGSSIKQTWSLAVEEHFYLFLTALLFILVGRGPRFIISTLFCICLFTIGMRCAAVGFGELDAAFRQTHFRIDSLLYGVILAAISIYFPDRFAAIAKQRVLLSIGAIALCVFIYYTAGSPVIDRDIGYVVQGIGFSSLIVLVYTGSGRIGSHFIYRFVAWVGVYSYGIYLWHSVALEPGQRIASLMAAHPIPTVVTWLVVVIAQVAIALILGVVMTRAVEWPALRLRERMMGADKSQLVEKSGANIM